MKNRIKLGDFTIAHQRRRGKRKSSACEHAVLSLNDHGDIVRCTDCQQQVSAYWALRKFIGELNQFSQDINQAEQNIKAITDNYIHLQTMMHSVALKIKALWQAEQPEKAMKVLEGLIQMAEVKTRGESNLVQFANHQSKK